MHAGRCGRQVARGGRTGSVPQGRPAWPPTSIARVVAQGPIRSDNGYRADDGRSSRDAARTRRRPVVGYTLAAQRCQRRRETPARHRVSLRGGLSSIGRASDCGSEGYGFKPRRPPHHSARTTGMERRSAAGSGTEIATETATKRAATATRSLGAPRRRGPQCLVMNVVALNVCHAGRDRADAVAAAILVPSSEESGAPGAEPGFSPSPPPSGRRPGRPSSRRRSGRCAWSPA